MKPENAVTKLVATVVACAFVSWIALPHHAAAQVQTVMQPAPLVVEETVVDGGLLGGGITLIVLGSLSLASSIIGGLMTIASLFGAGADTAGLGIFTVSTFAGGLTALIAGIVMVANSRTTRTVPTAGQGPSVALLPSIGSQGGGLTLAGAF